MFKLVEKYPLNESRTIYRATVEAPMIAKAARPGQFVIFRLDEYGERFPLTIAMYDAEKGTVTVHFQPVGKSTQMFSLVEQGDYIADIVGPLGRPAEIDLNAKRVLVVGGGTGCAINYPVARELHSHGVKVDMIAGFKSRDVVIMEDEFRAVSDNLYITTDDGSYGYAGFTTQKLKELLESGERYDSVLTCGPIIMMKLVAEATRPYGIHTTASLNPIMIDGTGMCGGCRLTVGGERKFACVDGPEFDAHLVDWEGLLQRNTFYMAEEAEEGEHICRITGGVRRGEVRPAETEEEGSPARRMTKHPMPEQEPNIRNKNFSEVALGYTPEIAVAEAQRCLNCANPQCVTGCPVNVRIPEFISRVKVGEFEEAYQVVASTNSLAAVCGRVCPQERQCESKCVRGIKGESVAIGRLERFVADTHAERMCVGDDACGIAAPRSNGHKVAVIGSGPSGLSCAGDLVKLGYQVTVFEALHKCGGVLSYGIPEFRLPKSIVDREVGGLQKLGVRFVTDCIIGRTMPLDELFEKGF